MSRWPQKAKQFSPKRVLLLTITLLTVFSAGHVVWSQDVSQVADSPVLVMTVPELPLNISSPILSRTEKGYSLKCEVSNSSNDQILGLTYILLVLDSTNKVEMIASRTAAFKLAAYSAKNLAFQTPRRLKLRSDDRVVLAVEQLISRESIWAVLNSRAALEAYAKGEYLAPEVKQMLNQVDAKPRASVIY